MVQQAAVGGSPSIVKYDRVSPNIRSSIRAVLARRSWPASQVLKMKVWQLRCNELVWLLVTLNKLYSEVNPLGSLN